MNTSCSDIQLSEHIVCSGTCLSAPMDADKFLQEHTVCANKAEHIFIDQTGPTIMVDAIQIISVMLIIIIGGWCSPPSSIDG